MKIHEHVSASEEIPERIGYCPVLAKFVYCHHRCHGCTVEYLKSQRSVIGACWEAEHERSKC